MTTMPPKEEKVDHAFYEELQSQLKEALNAKKAAEKALSGVEEQIEKFEGSTPPVHTSRALSFIRVSNLG